MLYIWTLISTIIFISLFIYLPGRLFLKYIKVKHSLISWEVISGLGFLILILFIGRWFLTNNLLLYLYLLIIFIITLCNIFKENKKGKILLNGKLIDFKVFTKWRTWLVVVVLFSGIFIQSFTYIRSAFYPQNIDYDIYSNHDQSWHASLISELTHAFPPQVPGYAGRVLKNYHYFYDLVVSANVSLFKTDINYSIQVVYPILISLLYGVSVWEFSYFVIKKWWLRLFTLFMAYWANNLSFLLPIWGGRSGSSIFLMDQPIIFLYNHQTVLSLSLMLVFLGLIFQLEKLKKPRQQIFLSGLIGLILGVAIYIKIYAFIVMAIVFVFWGSWGSIKSLKERKISEFWKKQFTAGIVALIISTLIILLAMNIQKSTFIFDPGWILREFVYKIIVIIYPKIIALNNIYILLGQNLKLFALSLGIGVLYLLFNFNLRFIFVLDLFKNKNRKYWLLMITFISSTLFLLLFRQNSHPYNIIQFGPYIFLTSLILSIMFIDNIRIRWVYLLLSILLLLLSIPTTIGDILNFSWSYSFDPKMDVHKIDILQKLRKLPYGNALFLINSYDTNDRMKTYNWIGAISHKRNVLNDLEQAEVLGIDYKERLKLITMFLHNSCSDPLLYENLKNQVEINYLIFKKGDEVVRCINDNKIDHFDIVISNPEYSVAMKR